MKDSTNHHQQQSWIDNELNAQEMLNLEERLSATSLEKLQLERTFQKQLGERLNTTSPTCPDALWYDLKDRMLSNVSAQLSSGKESTTETLRPKFKILPWIYKGGALAACTALAWTLSLGFNTKVETTALNPKEYLHDHHFAFTGRREKLMAALHHNGFFVELKPEAESQHPIKILGLDFNQGQQGTEARLVYSCCDEPVVITIQLHPEQLNTLAPQQGTTHQVSKTLDKYFIRAISHHNPSEALDLIF